MTDAPDWEWHVSSLTPILVVEARSADEVINIANFRIPGESLLRSPEGELAIARAQLGASAPQLARVLVAAFHALRSYQYGNGSPELAEEVADASQAALLAAGITVQGVR
jgi:hypothetical protein